MPQGLEVYRDDGALEISVTTRLTKQLGQFTIGTSAIDGAVAIDQHLLRGQIFWFNVLSLESGSKIGPRVFYSNSKLSWAFYEEGAWNPSLYAIPSARRAAVRVIYGVR